MFDHVRAKQIKLVGTDVDGCLTDNALYIGEVAGARVEFKRFDVADGLGAALLRNAGIEMAWVSGRVSAATQLRGTELKVGAVLQVASTGKVAAIEALLAERGLGWDAMLFIGDDLPDIPVLRRVGMPIAVANARPEVKAMCQYVTQTSGGHGAFREVAEMLLRARGEWEHAARHYLGVDP
jgi:3-deoxy-D-manno-octulosonate 8-phosphate phosphatase (KDO 8-P phosphatase)